MAADEATVTLVWVVGSGIEDEAMVAMVALVWVVGSGIKDEATVAVVSEVEGSGIIFALIFL